MDPFNYVDPFGENLISVYPRPVIGAEDPNDPYIKELLIKLKMERQRMIDQYRRYPHEGIIPIVKFLIDIPTDLIFEGMEEMEEGMRTAQPFSPPTSVVKGAGKVGLGGGIVALEVWGAGKVGSKVMGKILKKPSSPTNLALGIQDEGYLVEFAKSVKAADMNQWKQLNLYDETVNSFGEAFFQAAERSVKSGGKIKFNLRGLDPKKALRFKKNPGLYDEGVGYTEWELQQIIRSKKLWKKTEFYDYYPGQKAPRPLKRKELKKLGFPTKVVY